ncbi:hypothetical protein Belba_1970 [Belliella baltica DSM 15883]|uniref:Uncharacterized protein n=1 Tax=Belliella baltica (strain DSM 15883 / CIP 108006 / LMG 21964 / BA134) TaxID=866536 RepID=I3Z5M7_BELBD|nr:hypothetical protein Belba_1970 [Belliella baltica DSM 15883]
MFNFKNKLFKKKMIYAVFACLMMTFAFAVNAQEEEEELGGMSLGR